MNRARMSQNVSLLKKHPSSGRVIRGLPRTFDHMVIVVMVVHAMVTTPIALLSLSVSRGLRELAGLIVEKADADADGADYKIIWHRREET